MQDSSTSPFVEITTIDQVKDVLGREFAIIFKHSPLCDLSLNAYQVVTEFCRAQPDQDVFLISVLGSPEVSRYVTQHTALQHESPQVLAIRRGEVIAHASHRRINAAFFKSVLSTAVQA